MFYTFLNASKRFRAFSVASLTSDPFPLHSPATNQIKTVMCQVSPLYSLASYFSLPNPEKMGVNLSLFKNLLIIMVMIMAMENEGNLVTANGSWAGSKYQIECTMCAACDNPCATPSPPPPPPSPPSSSNNNCPPPPSPPSSGGNYYYSPPPPPPSSSSSGGGGGGNYYYSPPPPGGAIGNYYPPPYQNYPSGPTPPPPNPIVPYFPFYFYNPPPPSQSAAFKLTIFPSKSSVFVIVLLIFL